MYRFRRLMITGVFLLAAFMMFVAPSAAKKRARPRAATSAAASNEYTLRLVFDGLAAVWAPNATSNPGEIMFFTGPLNPSQLKVGSKMPAHQTHLLVQSVKNAGVEEVTTSGPRTLSQPAAFSHGNIALPGLWREAIINGEDLTLSTGTSAPLQVGDLSAVINLPRALASLPNGSPQDKSIQLCLTTSAVTCTDLKAQLSARFTLKSGLVSAMDVVQDTQGKPIAFAMSTGTPPQVGAPLAKSVSVEFKVQDAVVFSSRSLVDGKALDSMSVKGLPGHTVEVHIASHPTCDTLLACVQEGFTDGDFLFLYNLLNNPQFNNGNKLPVPLAVVVPGTGNPNFNGQCSPASLIP